MKSSLQHQNDIAAIRQQFLDYLHQKEDDSPVSMRSGHLSNTMRARASKAKGSQLDLSSLNQIISIDTDKMVAVVEPRVTMDQLVRETMRLSVIPAVIPEFKGISVGGAIMGAALESSSHRHGQFNDICTAYTVLLGNGEVIRATATEHADLFYGISGSYGSLGLLLSVEIKLIPAKPWVKLCYHRCQNSEDAIALLDELHNRQDPPAFIEGIVFSLDHQVVVEGTMIDDDEAAAIEDELSLASPWGRWYYMHVQAVTEKRDAASKAEKIRLYDYLFRHDRGAFWIGTYGKHWPLLLRYFLLGRLKLGSWCKGVLDKFWDPIQRKKQLSIDTPPSALFRYSLGWMLTSRRLYSWLHAHAEQWVGKYFVVQDCYIPKKKAAGFIDKLSREMRLSPLWLCPIKPTIDPQLFSPHYCVDKSSSLLINIGVYGIPQVDDTAVQMTQHLEQWVKEAQGRKMLYSLSYYSPELFWEIYSRGKYEELRKRYHARPWIDIDKKILAHKEQD